MSPEMRSVPSSQSGDPRSFSPLTISSSLQEQKEVIQKKQLHHCINNVHVCNKYKTINSSFKKKHSLFGLPNYFLTLKEWCLTESLIHSPSSQDQTAL